MRKNVPNDRAPLNTEIIKYAKKYLRRPLLAKGDATPCASFYCVRLSYYI